MDDLPRRIEWLVVCLVVPSTGVLVHGVVLPGAGVGRVLCSGTTGDTACYGPPLQ